MVSVSNRGKSLRLILFLLPRGCVGGISSPASSLTSSIPGTSQVHRNGCGNHIPCSSSVALLLMNCPLGSFWHLSQEAERQLGPSHVRFLEKRLEKQLTKASSSPTLQGVSILEVFSQIEQKDSLRRQLETAPNVWDNLLHLSSKRLQLWCLLVFLCHCTCMRIAAICPKFSIKKFRPSSPIKLVNKFQEGWSEGRTGPSVFY